MTTPVSWLIGFERSTQTPLAAIHAEALQADIQAFVAAQTQAKDKNADVARLQAELVRLESREGARTSSASKFRRVWSGPSWNWPRPAPPSTG